MDGRAPAYNHPRRDCGSSATNQQSKGASANIPAKPDESPARSPSIHDHRIEQAGRLASLRNNTPSTLTLEVTMAVRHITPVPRKAATGRVADVYARSV